MIDSAWSIRARVVRRVWPHVESHVGWHLGERVRARLSDSVWRRTGDRVAVRVWEVIGD